MLKSVSGFCLLAALVVAGLPPQVSGARSTATCCCGDASACGCCCAPAGAEGSGTAEDESPTVPGGHPRTPCLCAAPVSGVVPQVSVIGGAAQDVGGALAATPLEPVVDLQATLRGAVVPRAVGPPLEQPIISSTILLN